MLMTSMAVRPPTAPAADPIWPLACAVLLAGLAKGQVAGSEEASNRRGGRLTLGMPTQYA